MRNALKLAALVVCLGTTPAMGQDVGGIYSAFDFAYTHQVLGIFEGGLFDEPPANVDELRETRNAQLCTLSVNVGVKTVASLNTGDLDNILFAGRLGCGALVIHDDCFPCNEFVGREGISKSINSVQLCTYDEATRGCGTVVASAPAMSTTTGSELISRGEYESPFLTPLPLYVVKGTFTVSDPETLAFLALPGIPGGTSETSCIGLNTMSNTFTCTIISAPFRYKI